eukprot:1622656-Pleurochrysis_carterae.AAC.2
MGRQGRPEKCVEMGYENPLPRRVRAARNCLRTTFAIPRAASGTGNPLCPCPHVQSPMPAARLLDQI